MMTRRGSGNPSDDDGALPEQWLIAEWPNGTAEPTDFWIANLPADTPIATMAREDPLAHRTRLPGTENRCRT